MVHWRLISLKDFDADVRSISMRAAATIFASAMVASFYFSSCSASNVAWSRACSILISISLFACAALAVASSALAQAFVMARLAVELLDEVED